MLLTTLPPHLTPSYCRDLGLELGTGIDAITGKPQARKAVDFEPPPEPSSQSKLEPKISFYCTRNMYDLQRKEVIGFSGSITFPTGDTKPAFDFTESSESSVSVLLIIFNWECDGGHMRVRGAKLNKEAHHVLEKMNHDDTNGGKFRKEYGDYYLHEISYKFKFTAVWKCSAKYDWKIKEFETAISGLMRPMEMEEQGSFPSRLTQAANKYGVSIQARCLEVSNIGGQYDNDVNHVFQSFHKFRNHANLKPVPYEAHFRHFSSLDSRVPSSLLMDPSIFHHICYVFASARFAQFLIGVAPGTSAVLVDIYMEREQYYQNQDALKTSIGRLTEMRETLWRRYQRQELVTKMRSIRYEDMKRQFITESTSKGRDKNDANDGVWVSFDPSRCSLGRVYYNEKDKKLYGIQQGRAEGDLEVPGLVEAICELHFPSMGENGYIVGFTINISNKGTSNVSWRLSRNLSLGEKRVTIKIMAKPENKKNKSNHRNKESKMKYELSVYYIPCSAYDES